MIGKYTSLPWDWDNCVYFTSDDVVFAFGTALFFLIVWTFWDCFSLSKNYHQISWNVHVKTPQKYIIQKWQYSSVCSRRWECLPEVEVLGAHDVCLWASSHIREECKENVSVVCMTFVNNVRVKPNTFVVSCSRYLVTSSMQFSVQTTIRVTSHTLESGMAKKVEN